MFLRSQRLKIALIGLCVLGALRVPATQADLSRIPLLRVLIVGGGPDLQNNQVAIESNVRYLCRLLPRGTERTILFADGNPDNPTVLYEEDVRKLPAGERLLHLLLEGGEGSERAPQLYRRPNLGAKPDGAANRAEIARSFDRLLIELTATPRPLFLYFTGHGSPGSRDFDDNVMDLWGDRERLSVRELAAQIQKLPASIPVTLVMVQCYSGAFANLLFEDGDPQKEPVERDFTGFFAAIKERVAAGCTSALNEAEYRDFTSYFFAALTGRDRVGRRVTGVDYNRDGRIGMDEAFCYTLAHDASIDVPVCTSDVYLRRFVTLPDEAVFQTPYRDVLQWATPAQRYALETLSQSLGRTGEDRLLRAFQEVQAGNSKDHAAEVRRADSRFRTLRRESRRFLLQRWPALKDADRKAEAYRRARREAVEFLTRNAQEPEYRDLLAAAEELAQLQAKREEAEVNHARLLRFVRLGKSVVLAHHLRTYGDTKRRERFERLIAAEARSLLPYQGRLPETPGL
ncbi:MAG: hypothetical protein RMJ43_15380 [Chloroherpetonaceae bacterium]|nr:hypothetical protein [Chthonomonadaceae bacterium]MDW8209216.1 hypothetical protein [Chloroherpetonaceae bacterium]